MSDISKFENFQKMRLVKAYKKIKENPTRFKHLAGEGNCYSVRIGDLRIIYALENNIVWFLAAGKRGSIYQTYIKRLYSVREKLAKYGI